jgi:membrane-bound lytic murein transglycosylase MltF
MGNETYRFGVLTLLCLLFFASACSNNEQESAEDPAPASEPRQAAGPGDSEQTAAADDKATLSSMSEFLPMEFSVLWEPWSGDFEGMVERRVIRAVVPYGGYQFYYDEGVPSGAVYELLQRFESFVNKELERRHIRVYVVVIPVGRNELFSAIEEGHADLVAGDLTITDERAAEFSFSRPLLRDINEVIVAGPAAPDLPGIDSLAGQEIFVRESSSYFEHLQGLVADFTARGLTPPVIKRVDELLEAEDILELVDTGVIGITVLDDYKADFWAELFPKITVRHDLVINEGGSLGWAMRKDSPELAAILDRFLRKYGRGTLIGNVIFNRYLANAERIRCVNAGQKLDELQEIAKVFRQYGEEFNFDWLMLAAQGFQESGLQQDRRSPAGAVGIMQIKPSTASDPRIGVSDVTTIDNNVLAGAKYLRFIADRYFDGDGINSLNQWLLSLAAYNAGPARVARLRREAADNGYDPNLWFDNVEIIAARRIGRETVTYVANIFKYFVGYQIAAERLNLRAEQHGSVLTGCGPLSAEASSTQ